MKVVNERREELNADAQGAMCKEDECNLIDEVSVWRLGALGPF